MLPYKDPASILKILHLSYLFHIPWSINWHYLSKNVDIYKHGGGNSEANCYFSVQVKKWVSIILPSYYKTLPNPDKSQC